MLFHVENLVVSNNMVVRTADTDVLIIALINIEKLPAAIPVWLDVWLEIGLRTNNTLRYVNVGKLLQTLGNSLCVAFISDIYLASD